jgi:hypothetical protein
MAKGLGATMAFNRDQVAELLADCRRRCCICHRFCGVKIETDHIVQSADGGDDNIENAIPVCFDCHAEIHLYNDKHPRGRKFTPEELKRHRKEWLTLCREQPAKVLLEPRESDVEVGPLQALVDEIEFNLGVTQCTDAGKVGCPFRDEQFARAIGTGSISLVAQELKSAIIDAYVAVGRASTMAVAVARKRAGGVSHSMSGSGGSDVDEAIRNCERHLQHAQRQLLKFLGHGTDGCREADYGG